MIIAEPTATPVMTPVLLTVTLVMSLLLQLPVPGLALLSCFVAVKQTVLPPVIGNKAGGATEIKDKYP